MNKWLRDNASVLGISVAVIGSAAGSVWFISSEITAARLADEAQIEALNGIRGTLHQTNMKLDALTEGIHTDQRTIFGMLATSAERSSVLEATVRALEREISRVWAQLERMGFPR